MRTLSDVDRIELEKAVQEGLTQRAIGKRFGKSQTTVKHWLNKYQLKTISTQRRELIEPPQDKPREIERMCLHHGLTRAIWQPSKNGYRCCKCQSDRVSKARRDLKSLLVAKLGGSCFQCGYQKSVWALQFHHRNSDEKEYEMGFLIRDRNKKLAMYEVEKCDLLCANCHAEIEEQIWLGNSAW